MNSITDLLDLEDANISISSIDIEGQTKTIYLETAPEAHPQVSPSRKTLNKFGKPSTTLIIQRGLQPVTLFDYIISLLN